MCVCVCVCARFVRVKTQGDAALPLLHVYDVRFYFLLFPLYASKEMTYEMKKKKKREIKKVQEAPQTMLRLLKRKNADLQSSASVRCVTAQFFFFFSWHYSVACTRSLGVVGMPDEKKKKERKKREKKKWLLSGPKWNDMHSFFL